jgi:hypothetical protein
MLAVRIGPLTAEDFHLIRCTVLSAAPLTTAEHDWTRGVLRQQRVGQRLQRARPAQPPQGIAAQGLVLPPRRHVTSGAADIGPARLLHRVLEAHAIACAITQHYDRRTRRGSAAAPARPARYGGLRASVPWRLDGLATREGGLGLYRPYGSSGRHPRAPRPCHPAPRPMFARPNDATRAWHTAPNTPHPCYGRSRPTYKYLSESFSVLCVPIYSRKSCRSNNGGKNRGKSCWPARSDTEVYRL